MTKQDKIAYSKLYLKFNARIEKYGKGLFYKALKEQAAPVITFLQANSVEYTESHVDSLVSTEPIRIALKSFYESAGNKYLKFFQIPFEVKKDIQPINSVNLAFRDAQKIAELTKIAESTEVGAKIKQITDTTRKIIKDAISEGISNNKTKRQIIADINTRTKGQITLKRATLIARTESTYISSKASEINVMDSPFKMQKEWIPIVDFRSRDTHAAMLSKKPIPKEELFNVGGINMKYPGDPAGGATNNCNCRCVIHYSPIVAEDYLQNPLSSAVGNLLIGRILEELLQA